MSDDAQPGIIAERRRWDEAFTRVALRELLKLFNEIDGGRHARHPAVIAARSALGLDKGASDGKAGKEVARG